MKSISWFGCMLMAANLVVSSSGITPVVASVNLSSGKGEKIDAIARVEAESSFAKLPLRFELNRGQTDASVKFLARGKGYALFLTPSEAVLAVQSPASSKIKRPNVVRIKLHGANADPIVRGLGLLPSKSNYIKGNDPQKWLNEVDQYSKVEYRQVYPGIDMVYYGNKKGQLEYDFVVAPGANPDIIRMDFSGARKLKLDKQGNLVLNLKDGQMLFSAPVIYQKTGDAKQIVEGRFVLASSRRVRFEVGAYDKSKELVIDPSLMYSTYLGGTVEDRVNAIAIDAAGNVYLTGLAVSAGFPTPDSTAGHYDSSQNGGTDAFVMKIDAAGAAVWATFIGGAAIDIANSIAVDGAGKVYITGSTTSSDFPVATPYQNTNGGGTDAFLTAIKADGTGPLVYSTYLGGAGVDAGNGITVDAAGFAYITGETTSNDTTFPQTAGAYQLTNGGASDAFISKFSPAGAISYSTFLGGTAADKGRAIAIDGVGNAYVAGQAADAFPIVPLAVPTAFKTTVTGAYDAFIAKLDSTGAILLYATYVGGSDIDDAFGIALDGVDPATLNVYITGYTFSANFPDIGFATVGQTTIGTAPDAYVFKLNMNGGGGHLDGVYSTYLGGSTDDRASAIKVDGAGNAYVTGQTTSGDFPMVNPIQGTKIGTGMVFVTAIKPAPAVPDTPLFSTYLGGVTDQAGKGIALDGTGNIYVGGWTNSADYPTASTTTMPNIIQVANAGSFDGFFSKIAAPAPVLPDPLPTITNVFPAGGPIAGGTTVVITGTAFTGVIVSSGVKFGGINATSWTVDSSTQITAVAPPRGSAGIVNIVVTNAVGTSINVPEDDYTYFAPAGVAPTVTGIVPTLGPTTGGTTVLITGTGFAGITAGTAVKFGTLNAASYVVNSDTQITAKTAAHPAAVVDVVVTNLYGFSAVGAGSRYTYFLTPVVDAPFDPYIFPSPTTGNTAKIAYYMDSPGLVNIRIYNEIGDLVYTTSEERKTSGAQGSVIKVGNLAPGVYFYLLHVRYDTEETKKYSKGKFAVIH